MSTDLIANPFASNVAEIKTDTSSTAVEQSRAFSEVQSAMLVAKRFPRDQIACMDKILQACTRPSLAERATYAFPRGRELVTGPSIHLAQVMAQCWGNMDYGMREMSRFTKDGTASSEVMAFAWDLETNTKRHLTFFVKHWRDTKQGGYALRDERDIAELILNQASRRIRACILGIIPNDVAEAAEAQCETTLANKGGAPQDQIKKLLEAFKAYGIESDHIVKRVSHRLDSINQAEILQLKKIYASIRDGMAKPGDFFEVAEDTGKESSLNDKLKKAPAPAANQSGEALLPAAA